MKENMDKKNRCYEAEGLRDITKGMGYKYSLKDQEKIMEKLENENRRNKI